MEGEASLLPLSTTSILAISNIIESEFIWSLSSIILLSNSSSTFACCVQRYSVTYIQSQIIFKDFWALPLILGRYWNLLEYFTSFLYHLQAWILIQSTDCLD